MSWIEEIKRKLHSSSGAGQAKAPRLRRAVNRTRDTLLADRLELAGESAARTKGLLGRDRLTPGEGLWIFPCEGVHTFGMRFAIDLVYLDKHRRVRKVRHAVPPWRLSLCLTAESILELPAGVATQTETRKGDQIELIPIEDEAAQP